MPPTPTRTAEQLLEDLAAELEVPDDRYEAAERSYRSIGEWLERPGSSLRQYRPVMYPQGSFRLGTVIKPANDQEHYDLDVVCELAIRKLDTTQADVKALLGREVKGYAQRHGMAAPGESRRCWTLDYADGAQFHMDLLPALPDGARQVVGLLAAGLNASWADSALAITDRERPGYGTRTEDWPSSNPKGYGAWFVERMRPVFEARRGRLALDLRARAEDIPDWKVKVPLQQALQILKRHRDVTFAARPDERPISVIVTTLAARSYNQETTISGALYSILERMDLHIEDRDGVSWVPNPTDPRENFADRWETHPERKAAFSEWLADARADFSAAAMAFSTERIVEILAPRLGRTLMQRAAGRRAAKKVSGAAHSSLLTGAAGLVRSGIDRIRLSSHRKAPVWPDYGGGSVRIERAVFARDGFRPQDFASDSPAVPKQAALTFEAATNVGRPYKVYWQVTNTGDEAAAASQLRGDFNEGVVESGKLTHRESTSYKGAHGVECFIVKDGLLVARSGVFVVNIA
ncbi:nucleotidyltransferase [Roseomonas sp. 18066]|uniref:nucleotidyltransferase n=1 Tax=Roseomonas sp. 18066 TaxID=2681412 RepID=UPI0013576A48|nr:nucleotidyltransferase [Roseomonas sp. 18066]